MINDVMRQPSQTNGVCELCNNEFKYIEDGYKEPYHSWEEVKFSYRMEWYAGGLAGRGSWLEYEICSNCFLNRIIPALHNIGLPKKEYGGYIS